MTIPTVFVGGLLDTHKHWLHTHSLSASTATSVTRAIIQISQSCGCRTMHNILEVQVTSELTSDITVTSDVSVTSVRVFQKLFVSWDFLRQASLERLHRMVWENKKTSCEHVRGKQHHMPEGSELWKATGNYGNSDNHSVQAWWAEKHLGIHQTLWQISRRPHHAICHTNIWIPKPSNIILATRLTVVMVCNRDMCEVTVTTTPWPKTWILSFKMTNESKKVER